MTGSISTGITVFNFTGRAIAAVASVWLAVATPAVAQNASVYVANASNSRIHRAQFEPPGVSVVIDDPNKLTQVRDIAIREDGLNGPNLIVCDRNAGRIVFYEYVMGDGQVIFDASGSVGPARPDGMSLDLAGNLFVMNSGQGSSGGVSQAWVLKRDAGCPGRPDCLNAGYRTPLGLIDPHVQIATVIDGSPTLLETTLLPESLVATSTAGVIETGDLLVLANPGALLRYPAVDVAAFLDALDAGLTPAPLTPDTIIHPSGASVPDDQRFPAGLDPNGMAFSPRGELLITVGDGSTLIYGPDGRRRSDGLGNYVDFTPPTGQDELKIAVGLQDGVYRAFVTHQQNGDLRRYTIGPDGTGVLDAVVGGLQFPVGVDATTSNTVVAPAGAGVTIAPTTILSSSVELVRREGLVNQRISTFADPRESEQAIPPDQPLHRSLLLSELRADLPPIEIPAYARAFRFGDPDTGVPSFILVEASSNVAISGLVDHLALASTILGYNPDCADPEITRQPFMFWSPDANDPPIVEGAKFIDITTGCGSIRGLTRDMSYFLLGVRITAPMRDVAAEKLNGLRVMITGSTCIKRQVQRRLLSQMDRADREFSRLRYAAVIEALRAIDADVEQSSQAFATCAANESGEIQARVRSAIYALSKLP